MGKTLLIYLLILSSAALAKAQPVDQNNEQPEQFIENKVREVSTPLEFYPNPVTEYLNISVKDQDLTDVEFEVYNIIGNSIKIEVEEVSRFQYKIPVRTLTPGYYLLVINDKDKRFKQAYKFQKK